MISRKMQMFVSSGATIRAMFEEGKQMAAQYGADNVCDFSLGNPNLPTPEAVKNAIISVLNEEDPVDVHGYMFNSGKHSHDCRCSRGAQCGSKYIY